MKVLAKQETLKLKGVHQFLFQVYDFNVYWVETNIL